MSDMVKGIDVSGWQGVIHWPAVAESDVDFVFVKASEGVGFVDPKFEQNWARANEVGLLVGAYHFARVSHDRGVELLDDARVEAEHFWQVLERAGYEHGRHLPPVLDVEWDKRANAQGITREHTRRWALEFLGHLTGLCGRRPIVYCGPNFYRYRLAEPRLHDYPLWEANPGRVAGRPKDIAGWRWVFHQHSFTGTVPGIKPKVDLDVYNGDLDSLREFARADVGPEPVEVRVDWTPPVDLGLDTLDFARRPYPSGEGVERVQAILLTHGFGPEGLVDERGCPDGVGGTQTREAVGSFQDLCGLRPDYVVGPKTWWALIKKGM